MKQFHTAFKSLAAVALAALAVSCTSEFQEKENLAAAAGFKVITPTTQRQKELLPTLPKNKVTQITHEGKTYYVLPDLKNNRAYVGGPKQYQAYQQLRLQKQLSDQALETAQMNQMAAMNWGMWGGWGGWGRYGWY